MSLDYELYKEGGILNDRYQKVDDISEGSYGYVSLAKDLKLKKLVAIKYIYKLDNDDGSNNNRRGSVNSYDNSEDKKHDLEEQLNAQNKKSLISDAVKSRFSNNVCFEAMYEVDIQTKVGKHKNIAELLDFFDSYIIMEYCTGGDLYEAIKDDIVPKRTKSITYIISQIMDGIEFVHNKGIYHRDMKPENILITGIDWTIKITDWGLATTDEKSMDRNVGSERYMAPELFESNLDIKERKEPYDCSKVDLWAMGIVFLNIVFHKNPFSVADQTDKSFCYFAANREALFDVFSSMTYDFFQVLRYSLTMDPTNRDLSKMREELLNLSEYTFDDEYYNTQEDEYDIPMSSDASSKMTISTASTPPPSEPKVLPPSSAPIGLPTPVTSSKPPPHIKNDKFEVQGESTQTSDEEQHFKRPLEIPKFKITEKNRNVPNNQSTHYATMKYGDSNYHTKYSKYSSSNDEDDVRERAKSVPKIKYNRRPRVKNNHHQHNSPNGYGYNNRGHYNNHNKAFRMRHRNKSKIIKHSRKPLGIPTPDRHINTYIHDYRAKEDESFNASDFFTPPSVQHRYMEGIFDSKNRYHRQQYKNNHLNVHNNNNNSNTTNAANYSKSWNNKNTKFRRPSTTGNQAFSTNYNSGNRSRHSFHSTAMPSGTAFKRNQVQHSPGSYIPPNARNVYSTSSSAGIYSTSPHIPNISSVLDEPNDYNDTPSRYNNGPVLSHGNDDGEHDLDDALFSLDDGDHDYVNAMSNMSLNDNRGQVPQNTNMNRLTVNIPDTRMAQTGATANGDLPDLLKSPVTSSASLNTQGLGLNNNMNNQLHRIQKELSSQPIDMSHKSNVYVPPHHRRRSNYSTNEAVLSVSPNSINIQRAQPTVSQSFTKPSINISNPSATVAVQDEDVFRYDDNDALVFEDDDDLDTTQEDDGSHSRGGRKSFGPYQIYDDDNEHNSRVNAYVSNRRKSSMQDEVVGSLEQYKNNWLMLQQQQD